MITGEKGSRLSKIARELEVEICILVQFLRDSHIFVDPNCRIDPEICDILEKHFRNWNNPEDKEIRKCEFKKLKERYEEKIKQENKNLLNYDPIKKELDLTGFDLSNFTFEEIFFLRKYGNSMELMTLGKIKPLTEDQRRFYDFFVNPYQKVNNHEFIKFFSNTIQTKVWEKVLLSAEYYKKNIDDPLKLSIRNYYVYSYFTGFPIEKAVKQLNVFLKIDGRNKIGDDDTVWVKYDYNFFEKSNDKYINSLFRHNRIGNIIYTETAYDSVLNMGTQFIESKEGILQQVELKKIEVEMKIDAINNYSADRHKSSLNLDGYNWIRKEI